MQIRCLKIGPDHTESCACQVRGSQIVQTFLWWVKPQTDKFLAPDEHLHIKYKYYI